MYLNFTELIITRSFTSVTLLEGNSVNLSCIPSVIETVLSWTHNGANINENENISFFPLILHHYLHINNAGVGDSGLYVCRAMLDDEVVEQSISVTVVPGISFCVGN